MKFGKTRLGMDAGNNVYYKGEETGMVDYKLPEDRRAAEPRVAEKEVAKNTGTPFYKHRDVIADRMLSI